MPVDADSLIAEYGDQAYHKAVQFTVIAVQCGDRQGQEMFAAAARELLIREYHKKPVRTNGAKPQTLNE
jgi:hypothetical protein